MAKLTFDHAVIYNGVFYPTGSEIEVAETPAPVKENEEKPKKKTNK